MDPAYGKEKKPMDLHAQDTGSITSQSTTVQNPRATVAHVTASVTMKCAGLRVDELEVTASNQPEVLSNLFILYFNAI